MNVISVDKKKAVITIVVEDGRTIIINLQDDTFTNLTGRQVQFIRSPLSFAGNMEKYSIVGDLIRGKNAWTGLHNLETFWSVIDLVGEDIPSENPKGYINFVRENNETICEKSLKEFIKQQAINEQEKSLSELEKKYWDILLENYWYFRENRLKFSTEDIKKLCKLFKNSLKEVEHIFNIEYNILELVNLVYRYEYLKDFINFDKGSHFNLENLTAIVNKRRNEKILANEQKINPIMQLKTDNLCVIVPQTMEDFTDEGNMQNNCVGHYYHDDMSEGKQYIYFIRKKDNKEHSYVTCRYSPRYKATIEHRIFNNENCKDSEAYELMKKIDSMINEILK